MFRRAVRRCGHPNLAGERMHTYFEDYPVGKLPLRKRLVRRVRAWPLWKKFLFPVAAPMVAFSGYVGICTLVHRLHRPEIDAMFDAEHAEEYIMEDWAKVEPTLREGDIVLLMGTGSMSWKICNTAFVISGMRPGSIRYSHVGVVVQPAQLEAAPRSYFTAHNSQRKQRTANTPGSSSINTKIAASIHRSEFDAPKVVRGAMMLEAVDNKDINCPDWKNVVRHDCVQVVEIGNRVFGRQGERPCYHRFAVRRLQGFEWTPERKEKLRTFTEANIGREMDKKPSVMLAFMWARAYDWLQVRTGNEITCSELIADLYKAVGVIQRRVQFAHVPDAQGVGFETREVAYDPKRSVEVAPCHFAEGLDKGVLDFAAGVALGPEVRMPMPQPPHDMLYTVQ